MKILATDLSVASQWRKTVRKTQSIGTTIGLPPVTVTPKYYYGKKVVPEMKYFCQYGVGLYYIIVKTSVFNG